MAPSWLDPGPSSWALVCGLMLGRSQAQVDNVTPGLILQFAAVAFLLDGKQDGHMDVRSTVVKYMT